MRGARVGGVVELQQTKWSTELVFATALEHVTEFDQSDGCGCDGDIGARRLSEDTTPPGGGGREQK